MSKLGISTGTAPNDGTGDSLLTGAIKINANFNEIYSTIGNGTNLGIASLSQLSVAGITTVGLGTTSTPSSNYQLSFELTSTTNLRLKVRSSDGVLRSANITLA